MGASFNLKSRAAPMPGVKSSWAQLRVFAPQRSHCQVKGSPCSRQNPGWEVTQCLRRVTTLSAETSKQMLSLSRLSTTSLEQRWAKPTSKWPSFYLNLVSSFTGWTSLWRARQTQKLVSPSQPNCTTSESVIWVQMTWDHLEPPGTTWDLLGPPWNHLELPGTTWSPYLHNCTVF